MDSIIILIIVASISYFTIDKILFNYGKKNHRNTENVRAFSSLVHMAIVIIPTFFM